MLRTENKVNIKSDTKVFEGITEKVKNQAQEYAKEIRSYVFPVFNTIKKKNKTIIEFYGYGVPR